MKKRLKLEYCVDSNYVRTYKCSVLVVTVGRHVVLLNPYVPSRICGLRARHGACSHMRAHRSDQGAPIDPRRREQVPYTHGNKSEMVLPPRTRERMVVCNWSIIKH
jgi:hypothetical protein